MFVFQLFYKTEISQGNMAENNTPQRTPVTIQAPPNIPAVEECSGSTDLQTRLYIP